MRLSSRKCITLFTVFIAASIFCFIVLQSRGHKVPHLDLLDYAINPGVDVFQPSHRDRTGGWLTKWFQTETPSFPIPDRSVSPSRCPVYTYFDISKHRSDSLDAKILTIWKRSFWALGFQPIVLTEKDAKSHPRYNDLRDVEWRGLAEFHGIGKWFAMAQRGGLYTDYTVTND